MGNSTADKFYVRKLLNIMEIALLFGTACYHTYLFTSLWAIAKMSIFFLFSDPNFRIMTFFSRLELDVLLSMKVIACWTLICIYEIAHCSWMMNINEHKKKKKQISELWTTWLQSRAINHRFQIFFII